MKSLLMSRQDLELIKKVSKYFKPYKFRIFFILLCIFIEIFAAIAYPWIFGRIVVNLVESKYDVLITNVYYFIIVHLIEIVIPYFKDQLFINLKNTVNFNLRKDIYNKILNLSVSSLDKLRTGELIARLDEDIISVTNFLDQFLNIIKDIIRIITVFVVLVKINVLITLVVILNMPIVLYIFLKFAAYLRKSKKQFKIVRDDYVSFIHETLVGILETKSLGIKDKIFGLFTESAENLKSEEINIQLLSVKFRILFRVFNRIYNISIIVISTYLVYKGLIDLEHFVPIISYAEQFNVSLKHVTELNAIVQQAFVSFERMFEIIDENKHKSETYGNTDNFENGEIIFDNVSFKYDSNEYILNTLNLKIEKNRKIAIVGKSGCGKSTIFNLLTKFYSPSEGTITINGINLNDLSEKAIRENISIIRQFSFLFNMSIKDNFLIIDPSLSDQQIVNACKKAYIHDYIVNLPNQYNTIIGENGSNLSGGQKQRLAIARSLVKKSKIMLFDEVTSALDNESQIDIKKCIDEISEDHTVIMITHKLTTVLDADQIIVIDNGKIVASGTHEELIDKDDVYSNLYYSEFEVLLKPIVYH